MRTVEIPGGSAQLRDQSGEMKVRQRQLLYAGYSTAQQAIAKIRENREARENFEQTAERVLSFEESQSLFVRQNATVIARLASWTLDQPLPTMDSIGELDEDVYDPLVEAVRLIEAEANDQPLDFNENPDPESPTVPSSDSNRALRDTPSSSNNGTSTPSPDTGSTGTESSSGSRTRRTSTSRTK